MERIVPHVSVSNPFRTIVQIGLKSCILCVSVCVSVYVFACFLEEVFIKYSSIYRQVPVPFAFNTVNLHLCSIAFALTNTFLAFHCVPILYVSFVCVFLLVSKNLVGARIRGTN